MGNEGEAHAVGGKEGVQFWWPKTRSTVLRDETVAGQGDRARNGSGCRTDEEGPGDIDNNIRNISNNGTISKISVLTAMPMLGTERKAWAKAMWQLPFPIPSLPS